MWNKDKDKNFVNWVGKKIEECFINQQHNIMYWKVDGQWYKLSAMGDCCSASWYNHVDGADALQNAILSLFENVDLGKDNNHCFHIDDGDCGCDEQILVNMLKFATNKGHCTIEFRNASNGYYSGWCEIEECAEPRLALNVLRDF